MINWNKLTNEAPAKSRRDVYLIMDEDWGGSKVNIVFQDGTNFYVDDKERGSVNISVTHWIDLSDI